MDLTTRTCTPCKGGIPPLTGDEAKSYLAEAPGWALDEAGTRIERKFNFKNFANALEFVQRIGVIAEQEGHHPDICFGWGYCSVVLFTHKIKGLHENDFIIAAKLNALV